MSDRSESGLGRRRVLTGAAWMAPAVLASSTAPALASSCQETTPAQGVIDYSNVTGTGNYIRRSGTSGIATVAIDGQSDVQVDYTAVYADGYREPVAKPPGVNGQYDVNLADKNNGQPQGELQLFNVTGAYPEPDGRFPGQIMTMTFSRPVTDLTFDLLRLTWPTTTGDYRDSVAFSIPPTGYTAGSRVEGDGASRETAFRTREPNANDDVNVSGVKDLTFEGPLTELVIHYFSSNEVTKDPNSRQAINLTDMTFTTTECL